MDQMDYVDPILRRERGRMAGGGKRVAPNSQKDAKKSKKARKPSKGTKVTEEKKDESAEEEEDEEAYWERMEKSAAAGGDGEDENRGDSEEDSDDSGSDSDDDGEIKLSDMVTHKSEDFTFEFNDMKESFGEGICTLLQSRYLVNGTKAYSIAEVIAAQSIVGTAVVCEGAEDVFAFATVLPLRREAQLNTVYTEFINPLIALLQGGKKVGDVQRKELVLDCLSGSKKAQTGVLLHRRFANTPIELVGHLHRNLEEDLGWAKSLDDSVDGSGDASSADDQVAFKEMTYVLLLSSCDLSGSGDASGSASKGSSSGSSSSSSGGKVRDVTGSSEVLFDYFEDDVYFEEASACYFYRPAATSTGIAAILLPVSSFKSCANKIMKMVPGA